MLGRFRRWRVRRRLNLDSLQRVSCVDMDQDRPRAALTWKFLQACFANCMIDESSALQILDDEQDNGVRIVYCVPAQRNTWYEMMPPPRAHGLDMIRRLLAASQASPQREVSFIWKGKQHAATVAALNDPQGVVVYFGSERPRLLDKRAGDCPGIPTADTGS